jgi:UDP-glucose 4-epimerase
MRILVTGSEGLLGSDLSTALERAGHDVRRLDVRAPVDSGAHGSILDPAALRDLAATCDGIVHLAAISRVVHGERDPELCNRVNIGGTENVLAAALGAPGKPWVLFSSSREVYGEPAELPVREDAPLLAMNVYGRSKVRGEELVLAARESGLRTAILRLANVYGNDRDHPDRVIPAFARAAAGGTDLRIEGENNTFDFTHISDVVAGLLIVVDKLAAGERALPPIHLASGRGTTLGELARMIAGASRNKPRVVIAESRSYNVSRFVGDPSLARERLGWTAKRSLEEGIREIVARSGG